VNVAISLFFASFPALCFRCRKTPAESSLDSHSSLGMPILAGLSVAISFLFALCGERRLAAALLRPGSPGRTPFAGKVGRAEPRPMKARASSRTPNLGSAAPKILFALVRRPPGLVAIRIGRSPLFSTSWDDFYFSSVANRNVTEFVGLPTGVAGPPKPWHRRAAFAIRKFSRISIAQGGAKLYWPLDQFLGDRVHWPFR